uniref:Cullin family profile domain-containing protein n=1 Tax=Arcella intermedia TaxID=1963864 RepID=A0A6B2L0F8_9EUKA
MEPFIKITKLFYQNRAVDWMEMGISHYIDQTMRAVTLEENILRSFKVSSEDEAQSSLFKSLLFIIKLSLVQIHPIIDNIHSIYGFAVEILSQNVLEAVRRILISNNSSKIIDGMKSLLHQENWNYLSSIAQLFNSTNEIQLFADTVKEHIIMLGKEKLDLMKSINSKNSGVEYVTSLTDICCGFHRISKEHFDYDGVQVVLGSAYASVVNLYTRTSASVASYFNFIIRSGKNFDSEELITKITNGIFLVSYLNDKDYFFTMYEKLLAKRLVDSNNGLFNINLDVEQNILSLLTSNFGKTSVLKCERMFSDYYVSLDINERYNEWSVARKSNLQEREISTSVLLVSNNWPTMDCTKSTLSCKNEVLLDNWRLFEQFYKTSHSNRRLVPLWNYHRVEIFINHSIWNSKAGYQLNLDIPSFTVLSLFFTTDDNYNIPLISESTGYPEALVRFIISNFTDKKTAILMENKSTNSYSINANFSTRQKKLVFSSYQATTPENMIVCGKIQQERELFLDTIIVRIMKARKSYSHTNLLSEVIKLSAQRFIPTPALFKKRIQVLIEREFIVRDTDNMNILHYRA